MSEERRRDAGRRDSDRLEILAEEIRRLRFELAESRLAVRKLLDGQSLCALCGARMDTEKHLRSVLY